MDSVLIPVTTAQVVETSVTVNNSPIQDDYNDYDYDYDYGYRMTTGFKPLTKDHKLAISPL